MHWVEGGGERTVPRSAVHGRPRQLWDGRKAQGADVDSFRVSGTSRPACGRCTWLLEAQVRSSLQPGGGGRGSRHGRTFTGALTHWRKGLEGLCGGVAWFGLRWGGSGPVAARIEIDPHPRAGGARHDCIAERATLIRGVARLGHSGVGLQMGGSAENAGAADVPQHSDVRRNAMASRGRQGDRDRDRSPAGPRLGLPRLGTQYESPARRDRRRSK